MIAQITIADYFMGRDKKFPVSQELRDNAAETVKRVNLLLATCQLTPGIDPESKTHVASGWRPAAINDATKNSAIGSKHITGEACDIRDTPDRQIAAWCCRHLAELGRLGLWMERPQWTPTWCHWQIVPPRSGKRMFVPSSNPPLADPLEFEPT